MDKRFDDNISIGDKYGPAMTITDQTEANDYLRACIEHNMHTSGNAVGEAQEIERANLGYWAGYYDEDTRRRVERLFQCAHPILGPISVLGSPTPEEAFAMGQDMARRWGGR